jgi:hypothetical protein
MGTQGKVSMSMGCGRTMELLERFCVPWRRDTRDIVKVLVRTRITQSFACWHLHPRTAAHKTELCALNPYLNL